MNLGPTGYLEPVRAVVTKRVGVEQSVQMFDELRDIWHKTGIEILATLAAPGISATTWSRPDVTDHELVQAVRAGDEHAFERLYHRYQRRISAYVVGMVHDHGRAEDLTQEIFVSALRRMGQTDRPIAFKPWIYEIAKNACIDQFRRTSRTEEVSIDDGHGLGPADYGKLHATDLSPDAAVEGKQQLDHLCGAFEGLSQSHHEILVMRELEGLSYREISKRLDISQASVESTLFRARRRLAEEFEDLRTGERCVRIQEIIGSTVSGALGRRDQRRVGSHISHCQPCRRQAVMAGLDAAVMARRPKRAVRAKIAAFLPLPAFLRRRWLGGSDSDAVGAIAAQHGSTLSHASMVVAHYGEPTMTGWMKATAVAAAVAVAGVGAGAADHATSSGKHDAPAVQRTGAGSGGAAAGAASSAASGGAARSVARKTGVASTQGTGIAGETTSRARRGAGTGTGPVAAGTGASSGAGGTSGSSGGSPGSGEKASSAATSGGGAPSSSKSTSTSATADPTSATLQDAVSGATGAAGSAVAGATGAAAPLVQPDLSQLTQGPTGSPPQTAGQVVTGATDTVANTVGGQVGDAVKQTGAAVGETVDQVTQGVAGAAGGLLGGR
jgi:RNA polymerase sigma factor (sigma-70 family)